VEFSFVPLFDWVGKYPNCFHQFHMVSKRCHRFVLSPPVLDIELWICTLIWSFVGKIFAHCVDTKSNENTRNG